MKYQFIGSYIQATAESAEDNVAIITLLTLEEKTSRKYRGANRMPRSDKGIGRGSRKDGLGNKNPALLKLREILHAIPVHAKEFVSDEDAKATKDFHSYAHSISKERGVKVSIHKVTGGYEVTYGA